MDNTCYCKQCRDVRYSIAVINHCENGGLINLAKVLKKYSSLHPIAQILIKKSFQWTFTEK